MRLYISVFLEMFFSGLCTLLVLFVFRLCLGKRLSKGSRCALVLLVLYLSAMFNVVGLPGIPYLGWDPTLNLVPFSDYQDRRFLWLSGMNVLMTVPLGFFLPLVWRRYQSFSGTLFAGFFTSLAIELLQLFSSRSTDVDDLIFNTLGACLGWCLAKVLFGRHFRIGVRSEQKDLLSLLFVYGSLFFFHFFLRFPIIGMLYS